MAAIETTALFEILDEIIDSIEPDDTTVARESAGRLLAESGGRLPAEAAYHLAEAQAEHDADLVRYHLMAARDNLTAAGKTA